MSCGTIDAHHSKNGHSDTSNSLWFIGVFLSVVGSICTNLGVNLQKYSFMQEAKKSVNLKSKYLHQPLWVIGLLLVGSGSLLDFIALGFLPQSLATPVGGMTMVANVFFASIFLKERFTKSDAIGTGLVIGGICIVAAFANKKSSCYTLDALIQLYVNASFMVYSIVVISASTGIYFLLRKIEFLFVTYGRSSRIYKQYTRIHPVCAPALSGIFGAQSVLFAKSSIELIKTTIEGENQFTNIWSYFIICSMFVCIILQIHWLAHGLQHFDAVFCVPVFQCFFISVSIIGGGVYFGEFTSMSTSALIGFFSGAFVTLSGVFFLSRREMGRLRPIRKFRAGVKMIIFLKRVQKIVDIDYHWIAQPPIGLLTDENNTALYSNIRVYTRGGKDSLLKKCCVVPWQSKKIIAAPSCHKLQSIHSVLRPQLKDTTATNSMPTESLLSDKPHTSPRDKPILANVYANNTVVPVHNDIQASR